MRHPVPFNSLSFVLPAADDIEFVRKFFFLMLLPTLQNGKGKGEFDLFNGDVSRISRRCRRKETIPLRSKPNDKKWTPKGITHQLVSGLSKCLTCPTLQEGSSINSAKAP
ncbi:hypothetical protein CEXT_552161 [Caerostris extrusa]|uniref:Uncharacterized protein n=1 Tax=Caerostris extrusa TaxID=172846 RepID=A0AAV4X6C7_CAEEX|nr:hypothetical protein CEXT_552161 [Caerostris extrusa]